MRSDERPRGSLVLLAASIALSFACASALHATVETRRVEVVIEPDRVVERETLVVRIDDEEDLERWSLYAVGLDENRELLDFDAAVIRPDGDRDTIRRRDRDRMQASGSMILHSSQSFEVIEPEGLGLGARLEIRHAVATRPYFPSDQVGLDVGDEIESLEIEVRAAPGVEGFRHRLAPAEIPGVSLEATERSVRLTGSFEPLDPPALAPSEAARELLRFAWNDDGSWKMLGRWYAGLLAGVERDPEGMRRLVAELGADQGTPRERLDRIVAFLREKVRYVAVEVGIGGYEPSAPAEVVERRWGDCKDKGLLLVELLRAAGIDAHPALIRLDAGGGIDPDFPTPLAFNHLIVAIDAAPFAAPSGDETRDEARDPSLPVAEGFVFVDATQTLGGAEYLHEGVQGQHSLVVLEDAEAGRLVRTPWRPSSDARRLDVDLVLDAAGDAAGTVRFELDGDAAAPFVAMASTTVSMEVESTVRRLLDALVPGATFGQPTWQSPAGALPRFTVEAPVTIALGSAPRLGGPGAFPSPRHLDDLAADATPAHPASVDAGVLEVRWRLGLPENAGLCPPRERADVAENDLGRVVHRVGVDAEGRVVVERIGELRRGRVEADELESLRELALAEHRAQRRRLRLGC